MNHRAASAFRALGLISIAAICMVSFHNCAPVTNLDPLLNEDSIASLRTALPSNKMTLAVRGAACLVCHAQVKGDFITDFGFGQSFFFTRRKYSINGDWNTLSVTGDIIVPKLLVTRDGNGSPVTPADTIHNFLGRVVPTTTAPNLAVPGVRGSIVERDGIFIGAPSEEVIVNLTRRSDAQLIFADWDVSLYKIGNGSRINGLISKTGPTGDDYFVNAPGGVDCVGDIVVLGTLALNEATIATDSVNGCRLHVQKSVFIKGPINYSAASGPYANLQISSARSIIMGIRGLKTRLEETNDGLAGIRQASSVDAERAFNAKLYDERDTVIDDIEEAGPWRACVGASGRYIGQFDSAMMTEHWEYLDNNLRQTATYDCSGGSNWTLHVSPILKSQTTRKVDYKAVYFNAPKVHSRYLGVFKGVVVAEDAIFALQEFYFEHDPTFNQVPILPLLQGRILRVP